MTLADGRTAPAQAWSERLGTLGFGTAALGNLYSATTDAAARQTLQAGWDAGLRFFDTAPHYGLGLAEERLAQALIEWPRKEVVLCSKVGRRIEAADGGSVTMPVTTAGSASEATAWALDPSGLRDDCGFDVPATRRRVPDLSEAGIRASIEASCARLGVERLDIALLHDPEELSPEGDWLGVLEVMRRLRSEGVVDAIGIGSKDAGALQAGVEHADLDLVMVAGRFTLLDTTGRALLDSCAQRGAAAIAVGVYNSGILATDEPRGDATFEYLRAPRDIIERATQVAQVCARHDVPLPQAAVQFPFTHPAVANVTLGLRSPDEVREGVQRASAPVPPELWHDLAGAGLLT